MKKITIILLVIVLICSIIPTAFAEDFDYQTVLGSRSGYSYDKFDKTWSYGQVYVEKFNDGDVAIGMRVDGEDGGNNPSMTQIFAAIRDKNGDVMVPVSSLTFLIGDDLYEYSSLAELDTSSATLLGEEGQLLIKALADCNASDVAVKVGTNKGDIPIDLNSTQLTNTLKEFCRVYTKYNIWNYTADTTLTDNFETMNPLYVNGEPASQLLNKEAS